MKTGNLQTLLMLGAVALAATPGARAEEELKLEEIIVTATKMGETRLQETPIALSAYTPDFLDKNGIRDVRDLAISTPNLVIAQNGNAAQIYIRGIGSNITGGGGETSSTVHLDGTFIARPNGAFFNFLDVERIEVLRGPQGTLYGRNSVGGTINVISRKPDDKVQAKFQQTVGNYDLWRSEGYISGPLVAEKLSASISASRSKRDGYWENVVASGNDRASEDNWATRGQIRFTPTEKLEMLIRADYMKDEGLPAINHVLLAPYYPVTGGPEDPVTASIRGDWHKFAADTASVYERTMKGVSGEINYDLGPAARLKSLSAYRRGKQFQIADTDGSDLNKQYTNSTESQHQFSQELNLSGSLDALRYVFGLYYFNEHIANGGAGVVSNILNRITKPQPIIDTDAYAAYGQLDYDLTDALTATVGIRYSDEKKDFDQNLNILSTVTGLPLATYPRTYQREGHYKAWTPKFGLNYDVTDDVMLYASATRGFKSGGFNFSSGNSIQGYDPEKLWSYEGGFKSTLLDKRLRFNASAFYYDYTDLQVSAFITPGVTDITNAADATVKGLEVELEAKVTNDLDIGGTLSRLEATYKNFPGAPITGGTFDATGKYLNSAPKWSYTIYANYNYGLPDGSTLDFHADYGWKSRQYYTVVNDMVQSSPSYGLLNANITYTSPDDHWRVVAYGRNLGNEYYLLSAGTYTVVPAGTPGDPRTFGVRLSYTY